MNETSHESHLKDAAQRRLESPYVPRRGDVYRHYKGGTYSIVAVAVREDTFEPVVIYHSNLKDTDWEWTLANFTGEVEVDGRRVPRFARVDT